MGSWKGLNWVVLVHCGILSSDYLTYRIYENGLFVGETISPMMYLLTSYRGQVCQWQKTCTFVALYWADCNLYRLRHLFFNHWITEFFPPFVFVFFFLFSWLSWRWLDLYVVSIIHDFSKLWCTMLGLICESVGVWFLDQQLECYLWSCLLKFGLMQYWCMQMVCIYKNLLVYIFIIVLLLRTKIMIAYNVCCSNLWSSRGNKNGRFKSNLLSEILQWFTLL